MLVSCPYYHWQSTATRKLRPDSMSKILALYQLGKNWAEYKCQACQWLALQTPSIATS
jgi:hypothetical protein